MPVGVPGLLNDSLCDSSSTEARVLVAITGHGLTPPEGGMYYHRRRVTRLPPLLYPPGKRDLSYLYGGFSFTNSWCPLWEAIEATRFWLPLLAKP
ncbi:hypothetical protein AVEN_59089-1 [Araneus ventricosus]|uniref:Uncharacterized protein n=1 Tax=Araneus ventricosus TaxID=182803 RepID=A0A4Y2KQ43_ARAVE|nr:hypothetical protein AVEN_59089-1 [Araneus ventricosus]